jgi:cell division protein FtsQ
VTVARKSLLAAGAIAVLLAAWLGWGWFRDSSLVQVRQVEISGVSDSPDAAAIRRELKQAARRMTSLDVDNRKLEHAVSAYSIVDSVSASGSFPSAIKITVHEYVPVAALTAPDGHAVPVAGDGTLLPRVGKVQLPAVGVATMPSRNGFGSLRVRTLVRVLAAAPTPLRRQLERAHLVKDEGIVVSLRAGPALDFGTSARLTAKWASATRVLAEPSSSGATAIDVRLPERPAASGFGGATQAQVPLQNPQG